MDGRTPGIPDRRVHRLHTMYRDEKGLMFLNEIVVCLLFKTCFCFLVKTKTEAASNFVKQLLDNHEYQILFKHESPLRTIFNPFKYHEQP